MYSDAFKNTRLNAEECKKSNAQTGSVRPRPLVLVLNLIRWAVFQESWLKHWCFSSPRLGCQSVWWRYLLTLSESYIDVSVIGDENILLLVNGWINYPPNFFQNNDSFRNETGLVLSSAEDFYPTVKVALHHKSAESEEDHKGLGCDLREGHKW